MQRLHPDTLGAARGAARLPAYDRATLHRGIVHLGAGAFHRAHQALYTDRAIAGSGGDWGITGVSLRSDAVARQLAPQDGLFSVLEEDARGAQLHVVGALREVLVAPRSPGAVADAIADPAVRLVTLTVTEKGYCLGADGTSLDRANAQVQRDLADPRRPATAVGLLALGLARRAAAGAGPLSVLSCDNLAQNSRRLRGVLAEYLGQTNPRALSWLEANVAFPCSVVDRIVPAPTDADRERQSTLLGLRDEAAVRTEPFSQWIVEDDFAAGRPDWAGAGAELVADVAPYERIKLRLLNATHSAIAHLGLLAGRDTVDAVMGDAALGAFVRRLMDEALIPSLDAPAGFDLAAYREALLARFANPRLVHRCAQIAADSSEKIAQRWLPTLERDAPPALVRALALWCHLVLDTQVPIEDPRAQALLDARRPAGDPRSRLAAVLACARIGPRTVANFDALSAQVQRNLDSLREGGPSALLNA